MLDPFFTLTPSYIFTLTTQEKIFAKYLYTPDLNKSYVNPFRVDKKPGCTFFYKGSKLYFVDWAWEKKHYDCFNVVMSYYKCNFTAALKHIYEDLNNNTLEKKTESDIVISKEKTQKLGIKKRDYKPEELAFWNIGGLNITQKILEDAGIYCVDVLFENDWIIEHCKFTFAYVINKVVMQVYFPKHKGTTKRRFANRIGFVMGGVQELPFVSDYCVIGKSKKCSFFMSQLDIVNMYMVSESATIDKDTYNLLSTNYPVIFYLGDNDFAGRRLAVKYRQTYPNIVILLFEKGEPKDFTDNLSKYGFQYILDRKKDVLNKFNIQE